MNSMTMDWLEEQAQQEKKQISLNDLRINLDELQEARITPTCIVDNYLFADVSVLTAPGGTGKTTIVLHEMINIALGQGGSWS